MKMRKIAGMSLVALSLSGMSVLAHAELVIKNNTKQDSTAKINGSCSSSLPGGITKAGTTNKVSDIIIGIACLGHSSDCKAEVFMNATCTGSPIAYAVFDTSKGVQSVKLLTNEYQIIAPVGSFNITLNGGPAIA